MPLGPNMRRLMDSPVAESVVASVTAGPGDIVAWDVRAAVADDGDGVPLEVIGRGSDMEAAAAELWRVVSDRLPHLVMPAEISAEE
jgi:hypothetical protein